MKTKENKKVVFIVVLYSYDVITSPTLTSIAKLNFLKTLGSNIDVLIWDNSYNGSDITRCCLNSNSTVNFSYRHCPENLPLSKVYNTLIKETHFDWICIFDEDTGFDEQYVFEVKNLMLSGAKLGVPLIKFNETVISPGIVEGVRGRLIKPNEFSFGLNCSKAIVAMMSGVCISTLVFDSGIFFDERLTFYGIDTKFFIQFSEVHPSVFIMNVTLLHDSALRDETLSIEKKVSRRKNLYLAAPIVFERIRFYRFRLAVYFFLAIIKMCFKNRTLYPLVLLRAVLDVLKGHS